jgi:hypothetical protein
MLLSPRINQRGNCPPKRHYYYLSLTRPSQKGNLTEPHYNAVQMHSQERNAELGMHCGTAQPHLTVRGAEQSNNREMNGHNGCHDVLPAHQTTHFRPLDTFCHAGVQTGQNSIASSVLTLQNKAQKPPPRRSIRTWNGSPVLVSKFPISQNFLTITSFATISTAEGA